jgi:hypothetical protein
LLVMMNGLMYGPRLRGLDVVDADGSYVGVASDTWPLDGGGEPELVLVKVGRRFPRLRYLPLKRARIEPSGRIRLNATLSEIEDAPNAEDARWGEPAHIAKAHWMSVLDD